MRQITQAVEVHVGVRMSPHQFRHAVAKGRGSACGRGSSRRMVTLMSDKYDRRAELL
jgi:hypothetical protein